MPPPRPEKGKNIKDGTLPLQLAPRPSTLGKHTNETSKPKEKWTDSIACTFSGTPLNQAKCLLRRVIIGGHLGPEKVVLPSPLEELIGNPVTQTADSLDSYLKMNNINEDDIGGAISKPIKEANYFVIHDSSYEQNGQNFSPSIDSITWKLNALTNVGEKIENRAHVYISRVGTSKKKVDFSEGWRATKYEMNSIKRKGLFLHIELIQPRLKISPDNYYAHAPEIGFTNVQIDRLALIYLAASFRRGQWLIPAFHHAIDATLESGHNDPQNFDLDKWGGSLGQLLENIKMILVCKSIMKGGL